MSKDFYADIRSRLIDLDRSGLVRYERQITTPQAGRISIRKGNDVREMVNLCANNYLGLANNPEIKRAAQDAITTYGFGMASARFICGTLDLHRELERAIACYVGTEDAILFAAGFDANTALFETLLGPEDAIISDALNHASIIDGVRLARAKRYRYATSDMNALEDQLKQAAADGARFKMIATDGVFSMDGCVANLPEICKLAEKYRAIVMVDDCHATGHLGDKGSGTPSLTGARSKVNIITGTLGKTLGGAMGGFIAAAQPIIDLLRQRARPYLFSNSLPPAVAAGSMKALAIAEKADDLRVRLMDHTKRFRAGLMRAGFDLLPGDTPIIPVMLFEAKLAQRMAAALDERGVYVAGFFYPVVPEGRARIRTQMSAALTTEDIDFAVAAFADAGSAIGAI